MSENLSSCPLCDGKPRIESNSTTTRISCNCGLVMTVVGSQSKELAMERWETRPRQARYIAALVMADMALSGAADAGNVRGIIKRALEAE